MAENVENLMLEHLKKFQATQELTNQRLSELTIRQSETHSAVLSLRRDQVNDAEVVAHVQVQLDRVQDRLARIERRLELKD